MREGYEYGILGVGEIGTAIVTGLCANTENPPPVLLSPRNAEKAAALAARFPSVAVAPDNQALVDRSSVIVLAVRPADAPAVLGGLSFRAGHAVISLLAGVSGAELGPLVAPARDIARAIPLPPVARRTGITPVYPGTAAARALFARLGGTADVADARAFEAMSVATGTVAAHLRSVAVISDWLSEQGVEREQAARYVRSVFSGLAGDLDSQAGLDDLVRAHATPGGINERYSALLGDAGLFRTLRRSLETVYQGLAARTGKS